MVILTREGEKAQRVNDAGGDEIVFFDVETTFPLQRGEKPVLLEFGAVVVAARGLYEVGSYSTFIRPHSLDCVQQRRSKGITPDSVARAPTFSQVATHIFNILNGRVWAGHNIVRFDMICINEVFASINMPSPRPTGIIDTLPLLKRTFGHRAGDLKMASLAKYCGLGRQDHRSLADVRMNIEILKHCATILFLESTFPMVFPIARASTRSVSSSMSNNQTSIAFSRHVEDVKMLSK